jgi:hypothetical protein
MNRELPRLAVLPICEADDRYAISKARITCCPLLAPPGRMEHRSYQTPMLTGAAWVAPFPDSPDYRSERQHAYTNRRGRSSRIRGIRAIREDVRINTALWGAATTTLTDV